MYFFMKKHLLNLVLILALLVPSIMQAQDYQRSRVEIGNSTNTASYYTPFGNYYHYSSTQVIYLANDIDATGVIDTIWYYCQGTSALTFNELKVYMTHTGLSTLSTSGIPASNYTLVYSGTNVALGSTSGWFAIVLDSAFTYNGSDNLAIAITKSQTSYSSSQTWRYTAGPNGCAIYRQSDSETTQGDLSNSSTAYTSSTYRANIRLSMNAEVPSCVKPQTLVVENVTSTGATINWSDTNNIGNYKLYYRPSSDTIWTDSMSVFDTTYTFTSELSGNTVYTVAVVTDCGVNGMSNPRSVEFRTACTYLDTLPFAYGFEDAATGSSTTGTPFVDCWHRLNNGTSYGGYPYVGGSTYAHTGSKGLYWYNTTTTGTYGDYECVVLPPADPDLYPVNTLQLRFWAKSSSATTYPTFQVGVMTDPDDISSFTQVGTVNVSGTSWTEHLVSLASYTGSGNYVAVKTMRASWTAYVDDFTLEVAPACPAACGMDVEGVGITSASVSWQTRGGMETPISYDVEIVEVDTTGAATPTTYQATDMSYAFTGLNAGTQYKVRVRPNCSSENGEWDSITFATASLGCWELDPTTADTLQFSTGTSGISGCLANSSWGNTVYQAIWTAAELTAAGLQAGSITGIDLGFTGCTSYNKEFSIYMTNSNVTSISDATMAVPTEGDLRYGPALHPMNTSGYQHYEFDTPFEWDGASSIMITTFMNQSGGSHSSSAGLTGYYTSASNKARYRYQDSSPFTLSGINSGNSGTTYSYRANITFYTGECMTYATCVAPNAIIDSVFGTEIYVSWTPGYDESIWDVDYRAGNSGEWINVETSTSDYSTIISNLNTSTEYQVRVGSLCSDTTIYKVLTVRTTCGDISLPYTENFESYGTGTTAFPTCWFKKGSTADRPYINATTSYGHNNTYGLYFYAASGGYCYAILPHTSHAIDSLQVSFWARQYSTSYDCSFAVGVMSDPDDLTTFVAVDTVHPNGTTYEEFEVSLHRYTGTGKYIAFSAIINTGTYIYLMLDDVMVDYIPSCPRVENLRASYVGQDTIILAWNSGGAESSWIVSDGTNEYEIYDSTYIFDQLNPNTSYTFTVRGVCGYDDTSRAATLTVRTACGYLRVPYTEDFESYGTGTTAFPSCWFKKGSTADRPYVHATTSYGHNNTHGLYFYAASGGYCYAILPATNHAIDSLQVSFWARQYSTSYNCSFAVGVMSDPNDISTFVAVDTVHPSSTTYEEFEVMFNDYVDTGKYIAFSSIISSGSSNYLMLDDVTVDYIPACPIPGDLRAEAVARPDSVVIAWDEIGEATAWQIFLGSTGAIPSEDSVLIDVYDQTYTFTSLTSGVSYDIYVRSDCGTGEYSNWRGPLAITPGSITLPATGNLTTSGCGLVLYDNGGAMGNYSDGCNVTMTIYPSSSDSLVRLSGTFAGEGTIDYLDIIDGTGSGMSLAHITSGTSGTVINFGPFTSTTGPLTIHFYSDGSVNYQGFEIHTSCIAAPDCANATDLNVVAGTTSAYLTWRNNSGTLDAPAGYEVDVDGTIYNTTDEFLFATPLDTNTTYTAKVRSICDNGAYGEWDSVVFTTRSLPCIEYDTTSIDTVTIGNGGSSSYYVPIGNYYNYSYTQQLVLSGELNGANTITGIDFNYAYSSPTMYKSNCTIYLANTSVSSLSSNFVPYSTQFMPVYTGPMNCTMGWNHFEFDTPFAYDGTNLLIVILDNSGDYDGSGYIFSAHSASGMARYIQNDGSAYDITTVSGGTDPSVRPDMQIHMRSCLATGTCAAPLLVLTSFGSSSADVAWAPGNGETMWDVDYRETGDSTWTNFLTNTTTTSTTITGLNSNVEYEVRVVNHCSEGDFASTVSFLTPCDPLPLPFVENFDTWATGYIFPNCWSKGTNYSTNYPSVSTSYALSGSNSLYMYSSNSTYSYVALPQFQVSVDSLEVVFALRKTNTSYTHNILVGVMTDPADFSTFTQVSSVAPSQLNVWEQFAVELSSYAGTGKFIALVSPNNAYSYPYLDNLCVSVISPCMRPVDVEAHDITQNDATITWTDTVTTDFVVEYGPSGFAMGTGTVVTVNADSIMLTGLAGNTPYDVYVRGICGADTSSPSFAYSFRTACALIDSLPFTETFETQTTGTSSTGSPFIPCWTRLNNGTSYGGYPYVSNSTTYNHTPGGNKGLYWYASTTTGTYGDYQYVILPDIDTMVLPINTLQLRFWAKSSSTSYNPEFRVGVMTDPTDPTTFQPVDTISGFTTDWAEVEVPLTGFTGSGSYIAVMNVRPTSSWYAYVDDFTLEIAPTCARPNDVTSTGNTATTATMNWTERAGATEWEVFTTTSATAVPTGDSVVTAHPITLTGLTSGTHYFFYVRSICGAGDTSAWSDVYEFVPGSWIMRPNMSDTVRMCGGVIYDDGGATGVYSGNQNSTVYIMPDAPNNLVSISGSSYTESSFDYITIYDGLGTSGTQLWTDNGISSLTNFGPFISTNGPITVTFHTDGSVFYDGFEINVSCVTTTCRVMNIHLDNSVPASDVQLAIAWDDNGADEYQVEYGSHGFTLGSGIRQTVYTNSVLLTGLTGLTNYDVYVRSICDAVDTGSWSNATFSTAMCADADTVYSYDPTWSATTSTDSPLGYSFYNYGYVQTIIDSAQLAALDGDITAFAFSPASTNQGSYYNHCDVYLANVSESSLSGFIHPDATHVFVKVIDDADFCYSTTGWQLHGFDTVFTWDGHSNLLVSVNRRHGSYSSGATFNAHTSSVTKSWYVYTDGSAYDPYTVSGGYSCEVGDMMFLSCSGVSCRQPVITGETHDYQSATVTWAGTGNAYEVAYKETAATTWSTEIPVMGTTYTFTGLRPSTNYSFRVRQDCNADSLGYSEWTIGGFVTDSLPCLAPDSLHAIEATNATATLDWNVLGNETNWDIHVWAAGFDSIYRVNTHPATVSGFTAGVTYNATVRALCGVNLLEGDWSDATQFTTATCPDVTGLATSNVTAHSVTLNWNTDPMAQSWKIEYGYRGTPQGQGTVVTVTTNTYTVTGLSDETSYQFYVQAVCGTGWESEQWAEVFATTAASSGDECNPVSNLTVSDITTNSALVTWFSEYGSAWNVVVPEANVDVTVYEQQYALTGLLANTNYNVKVRTVCDNDQYSDFVTTSFMTNQTEGIDGVETMNCTIYPNPTSSATTISVSGVNGKVKIAIVDMNGRTVASETMECASDCVKTMDVENLAQGAYFVRITGESVNMVKKLVVR